MLEVSEEIGYGEWMVVSRRKDRKNGPVSDGPRRVQAQKGKSVAQPGGLTNGKTHPNSGQQYRPKGQHENGASSSRRTVDRNTDINPRTRPNENRPKPTTSAPSKEKSSGHRYEDNPLLRKSKNNTKTNAAVEVGGKAQSDKQSNKPIFSPVSSMEVVLDIPNPTSPKNQQPPFKESSITNPRKKPPNITTYHEFARASECNHELP